MKTILPLFAVSVLLLASCTAPSPYGTPPTAQAQAARERAIADRQRRASENELGAPAAQVIQQRTVSTPFGSRTRTSNTQVYGQGNIEVYDGYGNPFGGQAVRVTRGPDPSVSYPASVPPPTPATPKVGSPAVKP